MADKWELYAEAEKRGLLNERQKEILYEAKKRGLVLQPHQAPEGTLTEDQTYPEEVSGVSGSSDLAKNVLGITKEFLPFPTSIKSLQIPMGGSNEDVLTSPLKPITAIEKYGSRVKEAGIRPVEKGIENVASMASNAMPKSSIPLRLLPIVASETVYKPLARMVTPFTPSEFGAFGSVSMTPQLKPRAKETINSIRPALRKGTSSITGISEETLKAWESNPDLINAKTLETIATSKVPEISDKFQQIISGLGEKAKETLSTSKYLEDGAIPKSKMLEAIKSAKKNLGGIYTDENKSASNTLGRISNNFKKLKNTVSQSNVHEVIQDLDNEIPWTKVWKNPQDLSATDKSLISLRIKLDSMLKESNKNYARLMKPMSEAINTRNDFFKKFGIERMKETTDSGTKTKFVPSDSTVTRLKNITKESKLGTERVTRGVKEVTGENLHPDVQNALWRKEIEDATIKIPFTSFRIGSKGIAKKATDILRKDPLGIR